MKTSGKTLELQPNRAIAASTRTATAFAIRDDWRDEGWQQKAVILEEDAVILVAGHIGPVSSVCPMHHN